MIYSQYQKKKKKKKERKKSCRNSKNAPVTNRKGKSQEREREKKTNHENFDIKMSKLWF